MFRRTLLASAGAMALTGAAFAADLPSRAPPPVYLPPPPIFTWTGLYLGINAGYEWSNSNAFRTSAIPGPCDPAAGGGCSLSPNYSSLSAIGATFSVPLKTDGFIGGGQIGYNWQFANNFVTGIEADIQGIASSHKTATFAVTVPSPNFPAQPLQSTATVSRSINYLGTIRGRLGFLITPALLVYGDGGLAYGGVNASTAISQTCTGCVFLGVPGTSGSLSNSRVGWTAGGGLEWLFAPNWSVKAEYLYYDLGRVTRNLPPIIGLNGIGVVGAQFMSSFPTSTTRFNGNIVRAGLNYHFTFPPPVIAKY